jgi:hypothetical protein
MVIFIDSDTPLLHCAASALEAAKFSRIHLLRLLLGTCSKVD